MDEQSVSRESILENWDYYVQTPSQLAFSRLAKFPRGCERRLNDVLNLSGRERVLEIGSGLGFMADRIQAISDELTVVGCELNGNYIHKSHSDVFRANDSVNQVQGNGFEMPFTPGSFEHVVSHALVTLMEEGDWTRLHDEIARVVRPDGKITHMDNINNEFWYPEPLKMSDEQRSRYNQFNKLLNQTHQTLQTGYGRTAWDLTARLQTLGANILNIDTYSWTLDLNDSLWSEAQQTEFQNLWHQSRLDRIQRARRLWEATDELTPQREELLEKRKADIEDQSQRRHQALNKGSDMGWYSSTTLAVTARL